MKYLKVTLFALLLPFTLALFLVFGAACAIKESTGWVLWIIDGLIEEWG